MDIGRERIGREMEKERGMEDGEQGKRERGREGTGKEREREGGREGGRGQGKLGPPVEFVLYGLSTPDMANNLHY